MLSSLDFQECQKLLTSKLSEFQQLLQLETSNKWDLYHQNKENQLLVHIKSDAKQKYKVVRCEKVLNISSSKVFNLLWSDLEAQHQLDERQGKYIFLSSLSENINLLYFFLESERIDLLNHNDMFLLYSKFIDKAGTIFLIGCSIPYEPPGFNQISNVDRIECELMGFVIRSLSENKCNVVSLMNKTFKNRLPNYMPTTYDWDRGYFLEKIEKYLAIYTPKIINYEGIEEQDPKSLAKLVLNNEKSRNNVKVSPNDEWIEKYVDILEPTSEDFNNIEHVDLYNLYGEPFNNKWESSKGKKKGFQTMDLPKNISKDLNNMKNNRTKEYFANLMTKTTKK